MKLFNLFLPSLLALSLTACANLPAASNSPPIILTTATVQIVGTNARLEKTKLEEHVGYWTNVNTYPQWPLASLPPGTYRVDLLYSLDPQFPGTTIALSAAGQTLTATLAPTKNWDDYHPLPLGTLRLDHPQDALLTVKATNKPPTYVMNLQQVILTRQ